MAAVALVSLASACAVPASVDGVVADRQFSIRDGDPELRPQADDGLIVVIAEEIGDRLSVVQLKLPPLTDHRAGETIVLEERDLDRAWLTHAEGTLETQIRSDGARVVNTTDARITAAIGGQVDCEQGDGVLTGTLTAELEDGGWVEGSFVAPLE